jgi:hypothetical protein
MELWIARDLDGELWLYTTKPVLLDDKQRFCCPDDVYGIDEQYQINQYLFSEVTFENSPQEFELKLVK